MNGRGYSPKGHRPEPTTVHQSLGFAKGYATACLENKDIVGAARKLEWMRTEAQDWAEHPDFPAAARR